LAKQTTRERVRQLVKDEPTLNLSDIARRVGVSRERVRQLVESEGLAPPLGVVGYKPRSPASRVITGGVPTPINHTVAGTIAELLVAADLSARGLIVFFPLVRTAACDLMTLDRSGHVERIEVRCGHRSGKRVVFNQKDKSKSDRRAVVITGEPVIYEPPMP
jgi:hypothetical protein